MSQGNDFANYSAATNAGTGGSEEVWFVAVASDDIKQMTIDQLDEAFRLGVITGDTPVWTEGMEAWSPLAQVADLDNQSSSDESSGDEPSYEASGSHPKVEHDVSRQPATSHLGHQSAGTGSFGGFGAVTLQSVQHSFAPGPSSVAPVTASYAPSAQIGQSSVPVAIGDDDELPQAKRGGGFRPARWALAGAAAVIAVGVIAYNNLSSSVASAGTESAAAAPALAARPYDGADGAERGAASAPAAARPAPSAAADEPAAPSSGAAAVASAAAAASTTAKAALVASPSEDEQDEPPASAKKGADKDSLKNTFSKSLTKKGSAKAAKVKPRKAASRATKSRATKAAKKSTVVRSQSAFDPLNDSLP
jgi:hypothetical protein